MLCEASFSCPIKILLAGFLSICRVCNTCLYPLGIVACVAQWLEHLIRNEKVGGSNPPVGYGFCSLSPYTRNKLCTIHLNHVCIVLLFRLFLLNIYFYLFFKKEMEMMNQHWLSQKYCQQVLVRCI